MQVRTMFWIGFLLLPCLGYPADKANGDIETSFLGRLFGKQEDFTELKKQRRQLISDITRLERDIKNLDIQNEQLAKALENAPSDLVRLNSNLRLVDGALTDRAGKPPSPTKSKPSTASTSIFGLTRWFANDAAVVADASIDELKNKKSEIEQKIKDITERQQRQTQIREDGRRKRDDLEKKQNELADLEERISLALNTGTNQYIYRTVVSLIFAGIVAFLVHQFFRLVQANEEVKKSVFAGDSGIQFITLFSIVIAVILFGILEILHANELAALLGGLSGYILGKSSPKEKA